MHRKIVVDEVAEVERIYIDGFKNNAFNRFEASLLIKYFIGMGQSAYKAKQNLIEFCKTHDANFNEVIYKKTIDSLVNSSKKFRLKTGKGQVYITKAEVEALRKLSKDYAKIVYVMLITAKHDKYNPTRINRSVPETIGYFYKGYFEDAMRQAKVKIPKENINRAKYELDGIGGYISATLYGADCYRMNVADDQAEVAYVINDLSTMMDHFDVVYGGVETIECEVCHKIVVKKSNSQKMCKSCYQNSVKVSKRNYAKRYYKDKKILEQSNNSL